MRTHALLTRHNELLDELRREMALNRAEFAANRAEFAANRAAIYDARNAIRSMAAGIDQNTRVLQALEVEIHQNTEQTRAVTEGLLRVLDELRDDPPDAQ